MAFIERSEFTPRELEEMRRAKEEADANRAHAIRLKEMELEAKKIDLKWSQIFKIPLALILLPVKIVCSFALLVAYARKHEPSASFWDFLFQ